MESEDFKKLKIKTAEIVGFDEEDILNQSLIVPRLYQRYLDIYVVELEKYRSLVSKKDKLYGELWRKVRVDGDVRWTTKEEILSQIRADKNYYALIVSMDKQEVVVKYLEKTLVNIKDMSYNIKNYIDVKKFITGRDY